MANNAPNIPKLTDTAHNPGFPNPSAFRPSENQLSAFTKCAAMAALVPVTPAISRNRSKSSSKDKISSPNRFQPLEIA